MVNVLGNLAPGGVDGVEDGLQSMKYLCATRPNRREDRINDRVIAIDGSIRNTVHDDQRAAEPVSGEAGHVVIRDGLVLVDDADATRVGLPVAKEVIVLDQRVVTVAHRQRALALEEHVIAKLVTAGLVRDDLVLAIGANDGELACSADMWADGSSDGETCDLTSMIFRAVAVTGFLTGLPEEAN